MTSVGASLSRRNMRNCFLSILLIFAVSETLGRAAAFEHRSLAQTHVLKISRSFDFLEKVAEKLKQPGVTAEDAAEYANQLLAIHGFFYEFEACPVVKANPQPRTVTDKYGLTKSYKYSFAETSGRRLTMEIIGDPTDALCGECDFAIPLLRVTKRQMLVVSDSKQYSVKRPAGFFLKEISLVDRSMKKIIRTWEVPLDSEVVGVSEDGTNLYLYLYNGYCGDLDNKVVLEVSGSTIRFRARSQMAAQTGEFVKRHPTDPLDSYLAFKRFRVGRKQHIIRYDVPCT